MPNRPEFVVAIYACFHIGAVAGLLNKRSKTVELKPLFDRLRPALYIGDANLYSQMDALACSILPQANRFVVGDMREDKGGQPWPCLLREGSDPLPVATVM